MDVQQILHAMTLEEKIGQKIMLDFRLWQQQDMIEPNGVIANLLRVNHIGGVILFANNLKNKAQIKTLTTWYASLETFSGVRMFIGTDNEGGNVFRLPRDQYAPFSGNMALAAAVTGGGDTQLAYAQGVHMGHDLRTLNINTNFAPVVDVNSNPLNPVINVRSFSDDVATVTTLAEKVAAGMQQQGVMTAYKHFPGHGDTSTDSHTSLPRVDRSRHDAFAIDIAPFAQAIEHGSAPDMIMTAHIQYPALDDSRIKTCNGESILVPATMSREIQSNLLRQQLHYQGVTITDALDMGAIADHFTQQDALDAVFKAGVDIALMPVSIATPEQGAALSALIARIVENVKQGHYSEAEINESVARILTLKQRYQLLGNASAPPLTPPNDDTEALIADRSITAVVNQHATLPLLEKNLRYFILTPWMEQADGIKMTMAQYGYAHVDAAKESQLTDREIRQRIAQCDVFLLGTLSTRFTPVEKDGIATAADTPQNDTARYLDWLRYAGTLDKTRVHLSLRAPYDIALYANDVEAAVASYAYFGCDNGVWRGKSMISLAKVLTGNASPQGKLPVVVWEDYDAKTNTGTVAFPRGFGLSW
ncbi:glycoside hydrolase family 3 protein [Candidatus Symbiopectobacterium sp. NZEC127]|uniref:glycoside hydrolase family 3 protein n=1 Tax=Candidatus Symbiopectobacterium sp. NZEC127 TaxID=2820472 RepID=UPI0022268FFE|nr:glycoside hydrolase family 3 protein [Candidatus Symbiopectobacterium sp. NZEC127]MCW2485135.1 glycoside hydrolase family 3 protein [Candidatus Symbiopectobacterium sp. NZEC127]